MWARPDRRAAGAHQPQAGSRAHHRPARGGARRAATGADDNVSGSGAMMLRSPPAIVSPISVLPSPRVPSQASAGGVPPSARKAANNSPQPVASWRRPTPSHASSVTALLQALLSKSLPTTLPPRQRDIAALQAGIPLLQRHLESLQAEGRERQEQEQGEQERQEQAAYAAAQQQQPCSPRRRRPGGTPSSSSARGRSRCLRSCGGRQASARLCLPRLGCSRCRQWRRRRG